MDPERKIFASAEFARGWPRVLTAFMGYALGVTAIFFYTQGVFVRPLQEEFGWSRGEASITFTTFLLALAAVGPFCGMAVDRFGVRPVACLSILCLSAGFWMLSIMQGSITYFIAVSLAIGLFGSGSSAIAYVRLVCSWFVRGRGLAIGLMMIGTGVTAAIVPPFMTEYVAGHGWRAGYRLLALIALGALPLVLFFGAERERDGGASRRAVAGLSLSEAARTRQFWILGITFALAGCAVAGLIPHIIPMMQDSGMSGEKVAAVASVMGLAVIGGRLFTGLLLDHVFAPYIAAAVMAAAAVGCLSLGYFGAGVGLLGAGLIGVAMGAETDLAGYMSARYFGLRAYAAIFGVQYGLFSLGAALGPLAAGLLFDRFGSYDLALFIAAAALAIGIPFVLSLGRYPTEPELDGQAQDPSTATDRQDRFPASSRSSG